MGEKDKVQTPAPKVKSGKDPSEKGDGELIKNFANAEKGAKKVTGATKTPQKIQKGNLKQSKREDKP